MTVPVTLSLNGDQYEQVRRHLYPGDGKEAVAIALCGRRNGDWRHRLVVREICEIPHGVCHRDEVHVTWPPEVMEDWLDRAALQGLSVIKIHSHPSGYPAFSEIDDAGDRRLLPMIRGWIEADIPHGSVIMLPDGQMFGRVLTRDGVLAPIAAINVVGHDLHFWYPDAGSLELPSFVASHAQAFDEGTIGRLRRLWVAVIGVSGTGSPIVEMLVRLGVGVLVVVDDDIMKVRNINRILNSTMQDVRRKRLKVDVIGDAIERTELGTRVIRVPKSLWQPCAIRAVAQCDVVFGCMDTADGRFLLNALATYYTQAYFDVGVRLEAVRDGAHKGRIREVCGTISYVQPGRSSLISRELITMEQVAADGLRRRDPAAHAQQVKDGYIIGVPENRPAVITVNTLASSLLGNELLARIHPYREEPNSAYASVIFSLASMELITEAEEGVCSIMKNKVGIGDTTPLLGFPELSDRQDR
ncbi:MAG: ThiF family adenylyltransferase [Dongiaceae bacterium]